MGSKTLDNGDHVCLVSLAEFEAEKTACLQLAPSLTAEKHEALIYREMETAAWGAKERI